MRARDIPLGFALSRTARGITATSATRPAAALAARFDIHHRPKSST